MKKHISEMNDKELDMFVKSLSEKPNIAFEPKDWVAMNRILDKEYPLHPGGLNSKIVWTLLGLLFVAIGIFVMVWPREQRAASFVDIPDTTIINASIESDGLQFLPDLPRKVLGSLANTNTQSDSSVFDEVKKNIEPMLSRVNVQPIFYSKNKAPIAKLGLDSRKLTSYRIVKQINRGVGESARPHKFSFGLLVAPELSAVNIHQIEAPGRSISLNLEYFIHEKWSINTGIIHSYKTYAGGEGYHLDYQPSPSGFQGDCWVLDVPINLRFYAIDGTQSRWFVSSGVSSYYMVREKYVRQYEGYGENRYDVSESFRGNSHFFNVINLSIGYQRKLGQRLALHAEPYFKLPFSGIGAKNLSLNSAGIFLGMNYYW